MKKMRHKTPTHIVRPERHVCAEDSSGFAEEVLQVLPADAVRKLVCRKTRGKIISFKNFPGNSCRWKRAGIKIAEVAKE